MSKICSVDPEADLRQLVDARLERSNAFLLAHQSAMGREVWMAEDAVSPLLIWGTGRSKGEALVVLRIVLEVELRLAYFESLKGGRSDV